MSQKPAVDADMIEKPAKPQRSPRPKAEGFRERRRKRRVERRQPLEVRMTMRFKFGDEPDDAITVMDDRRVPMVDSVFKNRDRILRGFVKLLVKAGLAQPKVAREIIPAVKLLRRSR